MKLYFSNGSPFARKVRVVLAEKGLAYEADILDGALRPEATAPGPTLAIPVLEDGALRLWESDLIVDYLLRTYPDARATNDMTAAPPLSPVLARPHNYWGDMTVLATIATMATSIVNVHLMTPEGVTAETSRYMARQKTRIDRCLDWLETQVTDQGFAPGWFSILDIAFACPVLFAEARGFLQWRGRPKLDALADRASARPSFRATPLSANRVV
ncbi:MAG: glutathione S-transferase family protein [Reyranella sp.]